MRYSAPALAAAALVAASAASASPAPGLSVGAEVGAHIGGVGFDVGAHVDIDAGLCHGRHNSPHHHGLSVELKAKLDLDCSFFSIDFRGRMNTPAHQRYEEALEIYHDVMHLMRHSLMTRGKERLKRLVQIAMLIHDGEGILSIALKLNKSDSRKVRRHWISHEIHHLQAKFERAAFYARHLPNLCLAQDFFHFVIDASVAVVEFAVAVPIAVGVAVGVAIHEAAHLVARAFHYMAHVLKWAIHEIEYAFIMFVKKTKRFLKKVGHGIKAGLHAIGHAIHKVGHEIKEGAEDVVSIIVDIGHHLGHHHHCHAICHDHSADHGSCGCDADADDGYATITQVCKAEEKVCSEEKFTAKITKTYDIELSWSKEEAHSKVMECATTVFGSIDGLRGELRALEGEVSAKLESDAEE
jgi:hypothetical protein